MEIWIFQTGEPLHLDGGAPRPMRAMNLANILIANGHKVILWSSSFYHQEKRHRTDDYQEILIDSNLEIRLIPSPGYNHNISISRLIDHFFLARTLKKLLNCQVHAPNVAFIGYPPIESAFIFARWLNKKDIPYLLDVKDQWPSKLALSVPKFFTPFARLLLFPYYYLAKNTMRNASGISAITQSFLDWALNFSRRKKNIYDLVVPLTSPHFSIDEEAQKTARAFWEKKCISHERNKVVFIGSHSAAFDMAPVVSAARYFANKDNNIDFVICGNGPMTTHWQQAFGDACNVYFPGWVDRAQIDVLLDSSLAVLAPYVSTDDFIISVPNKVVDGLSFGKPILTGLKGEVEALVKDHQAGLFYGDGEKSLEQCIEALMADTRLLATIESNALKVYQEQFEFNRVYNGLVAHLECIANKTAEP